jgi:beta-galactosidase
MTNVLVILLLAAMVAAAQSPRIIGAEVMLDEAADTPQDIEDWVKILADHRMPLARIFMPRTDAGLRICDLLFRAAEKHGVKVAPTLGGPPTPQNADWIRNVVNRYKNSPALDSWTLWNEPGTSMPAPEEWVIARYRRWLEEKYTTIDRLNAAWKNPRGRPKFTSFAEVSHDPAEIGSFWSSPVRFLDWYAFGRDHLRWHLEWLATEVRRHDTAHPNHTNPNLLASNHGSRGVDLASWRPFLDTLGASAHQSWQYKLFRRDQYTLGLAYICDLIRGAIAPKPFWITEFQGGTNLYSSIRPLAPYPEEIAQALWTGFGSGAEKMIFWLLNNRREGTEAGEWSLLDYQGQPSERLAIAHSVASTLERHASVFNAARPVESRVVILLSLETMALHHRLASTHSVGSTEAGVTRPLPGKEREAHVMAALAYYEILHQLGVPVQLKYMHDFDWRSKTEAPRFAILPHVSAMSLEQARDVETFVGNGNTILLSGLSGMYDPDSKFWPLDRFPLEDLLGATVRDIRSLDDSDCRVNLTAPAVSLPCHLWQGEILNRTAEVIGRDGERITAVRKKVGGGKAIWIPSLVDVPAWLSNNLPLSSFLRHAIEPFVADVPFRFPTRQPRCLIRTMGSGGSYITAVMNTGTEPITCRVQCIPGFVAESIWGDPASLTKDGFALRPRATSVAIWRKH